MTNTTKTKTHTFEALGYTWEADDRRRFDDKSHQRTIARVRPINPETGEPLKTVKIGRVERSTEIPRGIEIEVRFSDYWHGKTGDGIFTNIDNYDAAELTRNAANALHAALVPHLLPFTEPLTREERFEQFLKSGTGYAEGALKREIDEATGYRATYNLGQEDTLNNRTPEERESVKAAWRDILANVLAAVEAGEVG